MTNASSTHSMSRTHVRVLLKGGPWDGRRHAVEVETYESTIFTEEPHDGYYYVDLRRPPAESDCQFGATWVATPPRRLTAPSD